MSGSQPAVPLSRLPALPRCIDITIDRCRPPHTGLRVPPYIAGWWQLVRPLKGKGVPVVIDPNVQPSKDPFGQRQDLSAVNHDVSKIFAALDFREDRTVKPSSRKFCLRYVGSTELAVEEVHGRQVR